VQCAASDLDEADVIVALSKREHRGLMQSRFPQWEPRTAFWRVEDIDLASPEAALGLIAREIEAMIATLKA
jgi:protein-tyrosine-phosphatase